MKLFTYGDDPTKIEWIREPFVNIGFGKQYRDTFSKFESMKSADFTDEEIVCFVDGYDVMQYGTLDEIEEKFKTFKADLVLSAETYCWPNPWMKHLFPSIGTKYKFPNCGMYIGYGWAVRKLLTWDTYRISFDDQGYTHDFYLRQKSCKCVLDHDCLVFQNCVFVPMSDFAYFKDRIVNQNKGTRPCFFHFSGGSFKTPDHKNIMTLLNQQVPLDSISQFPGLIEGP
jgi:hypothetical protein